MTTKTSRSLFALALLSLTILPIFQNCTGGFQVGDVSRVSGSLAMFQATGLTSLSDSTVESQTPYAQDSYTTTSTDSLILNIQSKQVFQRQGVVSFNGASAADAAIVPLMFKKASANIKYITIVISQGIPLLSKTFSVADASLSSISLPLLLTAGGWYSLTITQVDESKKIQYVSQLDKFGIGDVYLIAGQSNAAQHAEVRTTAKSSLVVMTDPENSTWAAAADPLPYATTDLDELVAQSNGKGRGSNWPELGDLLAQRYNIPIAFLNTAVGGSTVSEWQKGAPALEPRYGLEIKDRRLYQRLLFAAQYLQAKSGGFKMILWHQGESDLTTEDCNPSALGQCASVLYTGRFMQLKTALDADLGMNVKWMVARTTFFPDRFSDGCIGLQQDHVATSQQLRASQQLLWGMNNIYQGPESDDLKEGYRYSGPIGNCIHFSYAGQKEMASRWLSSITAAQSRDAAASNFMDLSGQSGSFQCRIGQFCISRTGGQQMTIFNGDGSVALVKRCDGPWMLDFLGDHYTNLCNGNVTVGSTLSQPGQWQLISRPGANSTPTPSPSPVVSSGETKVIGVIDAVVVGAVPTVVGWACDKTVASSIDVHVYVGGEAGQGGSLVAAGMANQATEDAVRSACGVGSGNYRYGIQIPAGLAAQYAGQKVYVYGISKTGGANLGLGNSGQLSLPK